MCLDDTQKPFGGAAQPDVLVCRGFPEETVEQTSIGHPAKPDASAMPSAHRVASPRYLCHSCSWD